MDLPILLESRQYLVINKPAGLNVEQLFDYASVENWVTAYQQRQGIRRPYTGIVHRLDRPVSGALLVAKKKMALKDLNQQFRQRQVRKEYLALVENLPPTPSAKLTHWIMKDQKQKKAVAYDRARKGAVKGELRYQLIEQSDAGYLLKVHPLTGKFHQIRVQLAAIGCPIVGDSKYGSTQPFRKQSIALHAHRLQFLDPLTQEQVEVSAPCSFYSGAK